MIKSQLLRTKRKGYHKQGLKLNKPILKQMIINPPCHHPPTPPPPSSLRALKLKIKSKNAGNIISIMGCYPRNGKIGDTEPALNITY